MQPDAEVNTFVDALLQELDPGPGDIDPDPKQNADGSHKPGPNIHQIPDPDPDPPVEVQPDLDIHNNPVRYPHLLYLIYLHIWRLHVLVQCSV